MRAALFMSQNEVEKELRELAIPVSAAERVWKPLHEEQGMRRDEDSYPWSVQAKEDEARKE